MRFTNIKTGSIVVTDNADAIKLFKQSAIYMPVETAVSNDRQKKPLDKKKIVTKTK